MQQIFRIYTYTKNFHTSSASQVNRVFLYVMDYADSESEVLFTPSRHSLMIFSVQNCKIAINFEKTLPYLNVIMDNLCEFSNYSVFMSQ